MECSRLLRWPGNGQGQGFIRFRQVVASIRKVNMIFFRIWLFLAALLILPVALILIIGRFFPSRWDREALGEPILRINYVPVGPVTVVAGMILLVIALGSLSNALVPEDLGEFIGFTVAASPFGLIFGLLYLGWLRDYLDRKGERL